MTYEVNDKQFYSVNSLPAQERFQHFVSVIADWEEIWGLKDSDGWATVGSDDNDVLIPFWPHPRYAQEWASEDWKEYLPTSIDLYDFIEKWIPGLQKDNYKIAAFPNNKSSGSIVSPEFLLSEINEELQKY